jgi:hypothetical protein
MDVEREAKPNAPNLIVNHFEDNRSICTKTGLIRSLKKYYTTNESAST